MRVGQVMSAPAVAVAPEAGLKEVATLLVSHGFSAVPVVGAGGELVGIVSEADLVGMGMGGRRPPATAREVMTQAVFSLPADAEVTRAANLMLERRIRSLPVTDGGEVVGMVSRRDLLRVLARDDDDIQAQVRGALAEHARGLAGLQVDVADGVVTLAGEVPAAAGKLAEALARDVPGVLGVRLERVTGASGAG